MKRKAKGLNAERDLVKIFHSNGWAPLRVAGSGSSPIPLPDILAGNGERNLALECKTTRKNTIYISHEQIDQLLYFAYKFGAEPWLAIRFYRKPWIFYRVSEMTKTEKSYSASIEDPIIGRTFFQLIGITENEDNKNNKETDN